MCDGCSESFDLCHTLNCKKGGLVTACHNEFRDLNCDLCSMAGLSQIISEPILQESNENEDLEGLRADWSVRGFWDSQKTALFDVCIFNADASSLKNQPLQSVFNVKKNMKKSKYCKAAAARRASFTPVIASCEAILDNEAEINVKRLATILSIYAFEVRERNGEVLGLCISQLFQRIYWRLIRKHHYYIFLFFILYILFCDNSYATSYHLIV